MEAESSPTATELAHAVPGTTVKVGAAGSAMSIRITSCPVKKVSGKKVDPWKNSSTPRYATWWSFSQRKVHPPTRQGDPGEAGLLGVDPPGGLDEEGPAVGADRGPLPDIGGIDVATVGLALAPPLRPPLGREEGDAAVPVVLLVGALGRVDDP